MVGQALVVEFSELDMVDVVVFAALAVLTDWVVEPDIVPVEPLDVPDVDTDTVVDVDTLDVEDIEVLDVVVELLKSHTV